MRALTLWYNRYKRVEYQYVNQDVIRKKDAVECQTPKHDHPCDSKRCIIQQSHDEVHNETQTESIYTRRCEPYV